ncbi:MAG: hypothetical protein IPN72_07785 [Saprospiraceae bacterium]|nr:hypothetical protein [Saprospiraceae bacterium]
MQNIDLLEQIQRLPVSQQLFLIEETLKFIQKEEAGHQMELAANVLYNDYVNDIELPVFTLLDLEEFYETK